jgi:hypothetical protein
MGKMHKRTQKILGIAVLTVALFFSFSLKTLANQTINITPEEVIKMVNDSRQAEDLGVLMENEKLSQAAQAKVEDMLKEKYFAHNSPSGKTPWFWIEKTGYDYRYAGENLAMDFKSAAEQHEAWMKSPTHRKNILNKDFREIGVAVKQGFMEGHLAVITVQEFGTPAILVSNYSSGKTSLFQEQVLGNQINSELKSVPILDKKQPDDPFLQEKSSINKWHNLIYLYLENFILMAILIANPFIIILLVIQFINFKVENEGKLVLKG